MNKHIIGIIILAVSLWLTTSATSAQNPCVVRADWTTTYTVVRGDSLYRIAQKYGTTSTLLAQGNCIANANSIYAGQVLRVPGINTPTVLTVWLPLNAVMYQTPNAAAAVVATIPAGNVSVTGRSQDTNWLFVYSGTVFGWMYSYNLQLDGGTINRLPVTAQVGSNVSATSCTQILASRLTATGQGRVLPGIPNNVRASASTTSVLVGTLQGGSVFKITGNSQCVEGILWWPINANGIIGWTGELQGASYWVEPFSGVINGTTAVVNTYALNVRNTASLQGVILTRVRQGEAFTILQWSADSKWIQINANGISGWIRASYVIVI